MKWFERGIGFDSEDVPVYDPAPLTGSQRSGDACVSCNKRWPRPAVRVGRIPTGDVVRACRECAPHIALQVHGELVRRVLHQALDRADAFAPQLLPALTAGSPTRNQPRTAVTDAAVIVARHLAETEDLHAQLAGRADGGRPLPASILRWEDAQVWLAAWAVTDPPAAVIREVLVHLLDTPGALAKALVPQFLARTGADAPTADPLTGDVHGGG